jgi:hypothetical protein
MRLSEARGEVKPSLFFSFPQKLSAFSAKNKVLENDTFISKRSNEEDASGLAKKSSNLVEIIL